MHQRSLRASQSTALWIIHYINYEGHKKRWSLLLVPGCLIAMQSASHLFIMYEGQRKTWSIFTIQTRTSFRITAVCVFNNTNLILMYCVMDLIWSAVNKTLMSVSADGDRLLTFMIWVNTLKLSASDICLSERNTTIFLTREFSVNNSNHFKLLLMLSSKCCNRATINEICWQVNFISLAQQNPLTK